MAARKVFGFAAVSCGVLVIVGSRAPLRFHQATLAEVWHSFLGAGTSLAASRGDLVANILLGIPFAYALMGFLTSDQQSRGQRLAVTLFTMTVAASLALLIELGQGWILGRISSIRDSIAQVCGAMIGCLAWWATGNRIRVLMNQMLVADRAQSRLRAAITMVALGVLLWSVLPLNVLLSPADLARKWTQGGIELIPFTRPHASLGDSIYQWIASACLALPLGLWAAQFLKFSLQRSTTPTERALIALGLGLLPEILQVPIATRIASATDAMFGVIGAALGIFLGEMLWKDAEGTAATRTSKPIRQPAMWYLAAMVFLAIVCLLSWYPFDFVTEPDRIRESLRSVASNPFSDYQGSNLKALFVFGRLAVLSAVLGLLAGIGTGLIRSRALRTVTAGVMCLAAFALSLGVELGQLLESTHQGAGLGLMMRVIGTWSGFALGLAVCRGGGLLTRSGEALNETVEPIFQAGRDRADSSRVANYDLYVPGMDGLRAIACLAVFGVHWQQMTGVASQWGPIDFARLFENGNTGVALFMILSGFLLALPIFAVRPQDRVLFSQRDFWRRRAVRILPAYYACLFALVIVTAHWRSFQHLLDVLLHVTCLHNMTPKTLYSISSPFWALAPIVQFYGLFALVILVLKRVSRLSDGAILAAFLGIALTSQLLVTAMALTEPSNSSNAAWFGEGAVCLNHSLPSHACLFGLGVLAAWAHGRLPTKWPTTADAVFMVCSVLCIAILATPLDDLLQIPGGRYNFPVVPLLLTAMVLAAPRGYLFRYLLETRVIRRLGLISYAFYIFHLPVMKAIQIISQKLGLSLADHAYLFAIASVGLTVIASELMFRLLERPLASRLRSQTVLPTVIDPHFASSQPRSY